MDSSFEGDEVFAVYCEYLDLVDELGTDEASKRVLEQNPNIEQQLRKLFNNEPGTLSLNDLQIGSVITNRKNLANRYRLVQMLGEGGMGVVWLVQQQSPVRRFVALKIIKLGMDSEQVLARFEAERQALAMMENESIAKFHDAGLTENGRSFFVMEFVPGVPINTYCDSVALSMKRRLELFQKVCSAVQHAHQKGIIHRDLKPSNVLVSDQRDELTVKIIDFGLAKALTQKLSEKSIYTEHGQIIGTLQYMPPEQAELSALNVDTRADVYALGAILYELISGTPPILKEQIQDAAFDAVIKMIRDSDFPRPSIRLSQSKELIASISAARRSEPRKLLFELNGDLDWITLKALEKDRTLRYGSAEDLRRDIDRYLNNEVIEARPHSFAYKAKKWLRRHRIAAAFVFVLAFSLLLTVAGISYGLYKSQLALRDVEEANEEKTIQANVAMKEAKEAHRQKAIAEKNLQVSEIKQHGILVQAAHRSCNDGDFIAAWEYLSQSRSHLHDFESNLILADIIENYGVPADTSLTNFLNLPQNLRDGKYVESGYSRDNKFELSETNKLQNFVFDRQSFSVMVTEFDAYTEQSRDVGRFQHPKIETTLPGVGFKIEDQGNLLITITEDGDIHLSDLRNKSFRKYPLPELADKNRGFEPDVQLSASKEWLTFKETAETTLYLYSLLSGNKVAIPNVALGKFLIGEDTLALVDTNAKMHAIRLTANSHDDEDFGISKFIVNNSSSFAIAIDVRSESNRITVGFNDGRIQQYAPTSRAVESSEKKTSLIDYEKVGFVIPCDSAIVELCTHETNESNLLGVLTERGWVYVFDLREGKRLLKVRGTNSPSLFGCGEINFFDDGSQIIFHDQKSYSKIWQVQTQARQGSIPDWQLDVAQKDRILFNTKSMPLLISGADSTHKTVSKLQFEGKKVSSRSLAKDSKSSLELAELFGDGKLVYLNSKGVLSWTLETEPVVEENRVFLENWNHDLPDRMSNRIMAFSPDKCFLSATSYWGNVNRYVAVWDSKSGEEIVRIESSSVFGSPVACHFFSDSKRIAVATTNGWIQLIDLRTRERYFEWRFFSEAKQNIVVQHIGEITDTGELFLVMHIPDPKARMIQANNTVYFSSQWIIQKWAGLDKDPPYKTSDLKISRRDHPLNLAAGYSPFFGKLFQFSKSGRRLIMSQGDGSLVVVDFDTGEHVLTFNKEESALNNWGFVFDSYYIQGDKMFRFGWGQHPNKRRSHIGVWKIGNWANSSDEFSLLLNNNYGISPKSVALE